MKTVKKSGLSFGFSAVNAGQRNGTTEPQVIAVSTEGNFRITPAVSKVLNIAHGETVMFLSNVDKLDQAISENNADLMAAVEEAGLEWGTPEALIFIHQEFDEWAIAKGIAELDAKGNPRTGTERLTAADKMKYVAKNFDTMLEAISNASDDDVAPEAKDALTREGISKDEQMALLTAFVQAGEVPKFKGSKAANPGGNTGAGTSLTFTDSNVWKQIKADLKDKATSLNRVFDVDLENIQTITLSNGYEDVTVKALVLSDFTDKVPSRNGEKDEDSSEENEEA